MVLMSKERWKNSEYREKITLRRANPEFIANARALKIADWEDPAFREKQMVARNNPAFKKNQRQNGTTQMSTPEARAHASKSAKAQWKAPGYRAEKSAAAKLQWQDPVFLAKMELLIASKRKVISINGIIYDSIKSGAKELNITPSGLLYRLNNKTEKFKDCFYII